jgi:hypothetical protein
VTVGLILAISLRSQSIFVFRSMALYGIPYYIWAAVAVARIRPFAARAAVLLGMVLLSGTSLVQLYEAKFPLLELPNRPGHTLPLPYREVADFIRARSLPGDVVAHTAHTSIFPLYYYGIKDLPHANVGVEPGYIEHCRLSNPPIPLPEEFKKGFMVPLQPWIQDRNRVWLIFTESERQFMPNNPMSVYRWTDSHLTETLHKSFGKIEVFLYQREQNGAPIEVRSRDLDDGVTAQLEYRGGMNTRYTKVRPDPGLVPAPVEDRKGALTVYFDDAHGGPGTVAVGIHNGSAKPVACDISAVSSDYLLDHV